MVSEKESAGAEAAQERPVINIQGERVALGPRRRDLMPLYERWMNDFDTLQLAGYPMEARTTDELTAWFERTTSDNRLVQFDIYEVATWRPIGFTMLKDIDGFSRTAEFGISIAQPEYRGKGYGTEVTRLMLDFAFTARSLHSVMLTTSDYNVAGQRAYAKAGFKEIGRRRECFMVAGRLCDIIYMDCLATEFESPVLRKILTLG